MEEMNKLMKDVLSQRMLSYVDCFDNSQKSLTDPRTFYFKPDIDEIIFNNMIINAGTGEFNDQQKWTHIELKDRKISLYNIRGRIISIDVSDGYIELYSVKDKPNTIEIKYVEFRYEQKQYNESHIVVYPLYGLELKPAIYQDTLMYDIIVPITMSPVDDKVFKITHMHLMDDTGIDGVVDIATNMYNLVLSKDFTNFFGYERITKTFGSDLGKEFTIINHRYSESTFLVKDDNGEEQQISYLYYFNNMIVPVGINTEERFEFIDETKFEDDNSNENKVLMVGEATENGSLLNLKNSKDESNIYK